MLKFTWRVLFFVVIIISLPVFSLAAKTYYVSPTGLNTNDGSIAKPWATVYKAFGVMVGGDTLYLRAGTYAQPIVLATQVPAGTSWNTAIKIIAYPGEKVTFTRGTSTRIFNFVGSTKAFVIISGLIFDAMGAENGIKIEAGSHHIRISDCEVKNSLGQGILITGGTATHHNEIINCNIHDNGKDIGLDHGIYIAASDNLVEYCDVHHNIAYGIHIYDGSTHAAHRNIVRYNKSHHNGRNGILLGSGADNLAHNNFSYSNGQRGIQVGFTGAINNKIFNNTVYGNGTSGQLATGIEVRAPSASTQIKNNIFYKNGTEISNLGTGTIIENNLTTDPSFVDAEKEDFGLKPNSLAIDAGVPIPGISFNGRALDIGAKEYVGATVPTTPSDFIGTVQPQSDVDVP